MDIDGATGSFVWNGGTLSVDVINGDISQLGGVLDPNQAVGATILNGDYTVASAGTLRIKIDSTTSFDRLNVNGTVDLNSDLGIGAELEIDLDFAADIGDSFLFLEKDGVDLISNQFAGLMQGAQFNATHAGDIYVFEIDYMAGDGNDVELQILNIL